MPLISSYEADLVTVTISGNDAGFAEIIKDCVNPLPLPTHCDQDFPNAQRDIEALSGRLADVYNAILDRAPDATVVVLTYPQIFAAGPAPLACPIYRDADENERTWIRARTADMDRVIRDTVDAVRLARQTNRLTALSVLDSFVGTTCVLTSPMQMLESLRSPTTRFTHLQPAIVGWPRIWQLTLQDDGATMIDRQQITAIIVVLLGIAVVIGLFVFVDMFLNSFSF